MLQGMGSLHCQHLQSPSAFPGGISSVAVRNEWGVLDRIVPVVLWAPMWLLTVQRWSFSAVLDMKLTVSMGFHPVLSLSIACVVWLHVWLLLGKSVKISRTFVAFFLGLNNGRPVPVHSVLYTDWDPDTCSHCSDCSRKLKTRLLLPTAVLLVVAHGMKLTVTCQTYISAMWKSWSDREMGLSCFKIAEV